ncbi:hypothetical protein P8452_35874 [Trifolium repens]|nr:hypothetical protein P8452_35874 [Trifolium repens]
MRGRLVLVVEQLNQINLSLDRKLLICLLRQLLNYRLYFLLLSLRFIISSQFKELKIIQNKSSQIFLSQGVLFIICSDTKKSKGNAERCAC